MTQEGQLPPPPVMWAQRRNKLFVTICLEDCKDPVIKIEPETLYFKGMGGTDKKMHEITIKLYKEIIPEMTVKNLGGRILEFVLFKKAEEPYWPRLTKEKTKTHWLKSDFNKWNDEDDSEDEDSHGGANDDLVEMIQRMGNLGNSTADRPKLSDLPGMDEADSDDEDLPDLE